jgi:hypothetical protein
VFVKQLFISQILQCTSFWGANDQSELKPAIAACTRFRSPTAQRQTWRQSNF